MDGTRRSRATRSRSTSTACAASSTRTSSATSAAWATRSRRAPEMSIRRRLLVFLLTGMLVVGLAVTALVFYQARSTANEMFDYQLKQIALALRDRAYLPGDLAETLQAAEGLDFVIQAWTPDGRLVYESHPQISMPATGVEGFSNVKTQLGTWR